MGVDDRHGHELQLVEAAPDDTSSDDTTSGEDPGLNEPVPHDHEDPETGD